MSGLEELLANATPGPWGTGHGAFGGADVHSEPESMLVAKAWPGVGVLESDNARLIALAPDLARLCLDMGVALRLEIAYRERNDQAYCAGFESLLARLDGIADNKDAA